MDRNEVVRISRLVAFGGLTINDATKLLTEYCLEHNKPKDMTELFVTTVIMYGIVQNYIPIALEYYEKKYTINKLQSKPNEIGQRQIIFIN